jgi:hypothetical protein
MDGPGHQFFARGFPVIKTQASDWAITMVSNSLVWPSLAHQVKTHCRYPVF